MKYNLNLKNPKSFNEKLQWLKINDRTKLHTKCADKYLVREYIEEKIGKEYLIPLIFVTDKIEDISIEKLPDFPVIIKPNHSRGAYIIKDKFKSNLKSIQKKLKDELKVNFYYRTREWQYKHIKPLIIVEKLLLDENNQIPSDYKFLCMNGKVQLIQVDVDRFDKHEKTLYNKNWERQDFEFNFPKGKDIKKPKLLEKMIEISEILSKDFIFVRVDLYTLQDKIYFGELTFHPAGGFGWFNPPEFDFILGEKLILKKT
ncbi:ATP-grasp fold amidoligase family protein [Malaciobacter mytili]|uniref:ATP-grasp fold amidoligase family protein n=1 Tax=Malaciobacter mytili TaxID=603050 RepID=UPI0018C8BBA2|nr:ATP-grasp fold amidoligase family protein [Malaciobacter mytili]